jgi:hypothetical protein
MSPRSSIALAGLFLGAACTAGESDTFARPTFDTLASGVIRVRNTGPTRWRDHTAGWQMVEAARITGNEGTAGELIEPQALAVDAQDRIWVVDQKPAVIKVYAPDGTFIRSVGREGQGPGEFQVGFIAIRGEHVVVQDPRTSRATLFDTAGTFIRSWHTACCYWSPIHMDRESRIYIPSPHPPEARESIQATWLRYRPDGKLVDTLVIPRLTAAEQKVWTIRSGAGQNRIMMSMGIPFAPSQLSAYDPAGGVLTGWSGDYSLVVTRTGTDTVGIFGRSWAPEPITGEMKRDTVESMVGRMTRQNRMDEALVRGTFSASDIPDAMPAFLGIHVDEAGYRWIRLGAAPVQGGMIYDVFDPDGAWLGPVRVPATFSPWAPQHWGRDGLVLSTIDEDGMPVVLVYRVEGRKKDG